MKNEIFMQEPDELEESLIEKIWNAFAISQIINFFS